MSTSYFPVGLTTTGDNTAPTGIRLALYFRTVEGEDVVIHGIHVDSKSTQTVKAAIYEVGGGAGGSGNPVWTDTSIALTTGNNDVPFDDPITLDDARRYLLVVAYPDGGHWGSVSGAGADLIQPPLRQGDNSYYGAYVDGVDDLPSTVTTTSLVLNSPWEQTFGYYGAGVYFESMPSKVAFSVARVDNDHVSIDWTTPGDAPDGISVGRVPGAQLGDDGEGRDPADAAYDPSTLDDFVMLDEGLTDGPYVDTVPDPGGYTYWVVRTAEV